MDIARILSEALISVSRVDLTAGNNDSAYRKQMRIILDSPGLRHALAKARDAPFSEEITPEKPKRKRTPKTDD